MKKLLFAVLFLFTINLFAQDQPTNPDGIAPSIHLMPYWYKVDQLDIQNKLSFDVEVKVPLTYYLTLSGFYQKSNFEVASLNPIKYDASRYGFKVSYYLNHLLK